MTKPQLSLIRLASVDHADGGTKWRKRMERWLALKREPKRRLGLSAWIMPRKYKSLFSEEWAAVLNK